MSAQLVIFNGEDQCLENYRNNIEATMEVSGAPRRSSRPTIKPVKFWDFEKPDYSNPDHITYKITDLTNFNKPISVDGTLKKSFANTKLSKEKAVNNVSKKLSKVNSKRAPKKSVASSENKENTQQVAPKDKPTTESTTNGANTVGSYYDTPLSTKQKKRLVMAFQKKIKDHHNTLPSAPDTDVKRGNVGIRMKPLEMQQNSEEGIIKETNNGEPQIKHHGKVMDTREKQSTEFLKRKMDHAHDDHKSPPKRKKSFEKLTKSNDQETKKLRKLSSDSKEQRRLSKDDHEQDNESEMGKDQESLAGMSVSNYRDLFFQRYQTKECCCYLAKSFNNSKMGVFTGFVFLERGNLVWMTKMNIFIMVVGGRGKVRIVDIPTKDGVQITLTSGVKFTVAPGMRAEITKDSRFKMLKMFVQLTPQSSSIEK